MHDVRNCQIPNLRNFSKFFPAYLRTNDIISQIMCAKLTIILIIVRRSAYIRMLYSRIKANDPAAGFEVAFSSGLPDDK